MEKVINKPNVHIVGCGLSGMVIARSLAEKDFKVKIYERRRHIGGNLYDYVDESGFLVQKYGPHCFFTNDERIRPYIERFAETEDHFVKGMTVIDGKFIPMPFNFQSLSIIYPEDKAREIRESLIAEFGEGAIVSVTDLLESKNSLIKEYGQYMYEHEYRLYTAKQWGRDIEDISPSIFKRVPVHISSYGAYLSHDIQFFPKGGFTRLSEEILRHPNISVELGVDAIKEKKICITAEGLLVNGSKADKDVVVYTGEIDSLLGYKYGRLPYRSLEFVWKTIDKDEFQPTETVAYPEVEKITRVTEYKKLPPQKNDCQQTRISIEIPFEYNPELPVGNEPYYPINNPQNIAAYEKYAADASKIDNLYVCGRLGDYKYYNMDMTILRAWDIAEKIVEKNS